MIKDTANALRQQITNREGIFHKFKITYKRVIFVVVAVRRLHQEIKEVFDDYNQSQDMKSKLLTGRRVTLVEELSKY
jgi:hypothetical protein